MNGDRGQRSRSSWLAVAQSVDKVPRATNSIGRRRFAALGVAQRCSPAVPVTVIRWRDARVRRRAIRE